MSESSHPLSTRAPMPAPGGRLQKPGGTTPTFDLKAEFLRMARMWTELADRPDSPH
jgi:hypothetical protein